MGAEQSSPEENQSSSQEQSFQDKFTRMVDLAKLNLDSDLQQKKQWKKR